VAKDLSIEAGASAVCLDFFTISLQAIVQIPVTATFYSNFFAFQMEAL
jgi:hypothetical protein